MSIYQADVWYKVKGETLVMIRYGLYSLERDMREDHMSTADLLQRLRTIREMLPDNPPVMYDPPI